MWRPVLSGVFVIAGLMWLLTDMLRGPVTPSTGSPTLQEVNIVVVPPTPGQPIAIALPARNLPDHRCGPAAETALGEQRDGGADDCALAALLEYDPTLSETSSEQDPAVADSTATRRANATRTASRRPFRRAVATAKSAVVDQPPQSKPSVTWRFPSDPNVGGAG